MHPPNLKRIVRSGVLLLLVASAGFLVKAEEGTWTAEVEGAAVSSNGWLRVSGGIEGDPFMDSCLRLYRSSDLRTWREIAVLQGRRFTFLDPGANAESGFYRFVAEPLNETNADWKNQIWSHGDYFGSEYVKFVIRKDDPTRVYYSDGQRHQFHFDFVSSRLDGYAGLPGTRFQEITRRNESRELYIGSVIFPSSDAEYGIQFDSLDALPPDEVINLFRLVESTVVNSRGTNVAPRRAFYLPAFEQINSARANANYFETNGIPLASHERWAFNDAAYSFGRAVGRLKYVPSTNINAAYAAGELLATDILLTDGIPAEIPFVSGIVSLAPATPNSHVAILARSYGVPFVYFRDEAMRQEVVGWTNREVALEAFQTWGGSDIKILPLSENFPAELRAEMQKFTASGKIEITPKARFGAYTAATDALTPADIKHFGGKAANFGILTRTIPSNSPPAIAISIDLWDDFMAQSLGNGRTLWEEIAARMQPHTNGSNIAELKTALAGIRDLIRQSATFTADQQQSITNALSVFDPARKLRFRSSTNVEDAESFTGAGLYDSYSGCLLDDLDADTSGPCRCDPAENNERGVFRAIRRVYSSFYNDNAVLARLRLGIDEPEVGMGILVHHSTPDEEELANGVATVLSRGYFGPNQYRDYHTDMVTQLGATSVANPDTAALPEVASAYTAGSTGFAVTQYSNLLPLGQSVLSMDEYFTFIEDLFIPVAKAWHELYTNKYEFSLDFEYKKVAPDHLQVKQVREIPLPDRSQQVETFLLKSEEHRETRRGVGVGAFPTHRAKTLWSFTTRNMRLTETNILSQGLFESISFNRAVNGVIEKFSGDPKALPGYASGYTNGVYYINWDAATDDGPAAATLWVNLYGVIGSPAQSLFVTLDDFYAGFSLDYPHTNVHHFDWWGDLQKGSSDGTDIREPLVRLPTDVLFSYDLTVTNQANTNYTIRLQTEFWLDGPAIYISYPLQVGNLSTRIEGLTSEPIVLKDYFSQSYDNVHILRSERFVFEPRLEPNISAQTLAELEALDIVQLVFTHRFGIPRLRIIGRDRELREW